MTLDFRPAEEDPPAIFTRAVQALRFGPPLSIAEQTELHDVWDGEVGNAFFWAFTEAFFPDAPDGYFADPEPYSDEPYVDD